MIALDALLDGKHHSGRYGDQPAVQHSCYAIPYDELFEDATLIAELLDEYTPPHSCVSVPIVDHFWWIKPVLGALMARRVVMPCSLEDLDSSSNLSATVQPTGYLRRKRLPSLTFTDYTSGMTSGAAMAGGIEYVPYEAKSKTFHPDACYVAVSSGTIGRPKLILGSRKGLSQFLDAEVGLLTEITPSPAFSTLRLAPHSFDVFWRDILLPLVSGGTVHLLDRFAHRREPELLVTAIEQLKPNVLHIVPSLARSIAHRLPEQRLCSVKGILFAGEPLHPKDVEPWFAHTTATPVNVYGTSETTLAKFFHVVKPEDLGRRRIPVGRCIQGSAAVAVTEGRACYPGEVGEIYIKTSFPLHGYLGNDAEGILVPNPLTGNPSDVVHRTGDAGSFDDSGVLDLVGRTDDMVKLRGYRVDLSDVERIVRSHPGIEDCAAIVRDSDGGTDSLLYVFVVLSSKLVRTEEILDWLHEQLPAQALPQALLAIDAIPRGERGKVARDKLQQLSIPLTGRTISTSAADPLVSMIVASFRSVLSIRGDIRPDDSFRALGGQSIHAAQLSRRLADEGLSVSMAEVLRLRTPYKIATHIAGTDARPVVNVRSSSRMSAATPGVRRPVSMSQARFLRLMSTRGTQHTAFRYLWAAKITAETQRDHLQDAIRAVCGEQFLQALRIERTSTSEWQQYVDTSVREVRFDAIPETNMTEAREWLIAWAKRPLALGADPPIRFALSNSSTDTFLLAISGNVLWSDGFSKDALLRRVSRYLNQSHSSAPPPSYTTYPAWESEWLGSNEAERRLTYWRGNLPEELLPPFPNATQGLRFFGSGRSYPTVWRAAEIDISGPLFAEAQQHGTTLNACLLWGLIEAFKSCEIDFCPLIMYPDPNRYRADEIDVYGCLTETLIVDPERVSRDCIQGITHVGQLIAEGIDNALPFEFVISKTYPTIDLSKDASEPILFPVMFAPQPALDTSLQMPPGRVEVFASTGDLGELPFPIVAAPTIGEESIILRIGMFTTKRGLPSIDGLLDSWRRTLTQPSFSHRLNVTG